MSNFNSLHYANRLKEAGVPDQQVIVQTEVILEILDIIEKKFTNCASKDDLKNFATKDDFKHLEVRLDGRIDLLDAKINTVEAVLSAKIANVDTKLNWLMTLMGAIGVVLALLNFVHFHIS